MNILVFARAPEPGWSKTRLIPALGAEGAAALHTRLLARTLDIATSAGIGAVQLWCTPDTEHPYFAVCRQRYGVNLHRQQGADLGERMDRALQEALGRQRNALLIGCDAPTLSVAHLQEANRQLTAGVDVVIGPAEDGGYVLIGLSRPCPALFTAMPWGSDRVLALTRERIAALGLRAHELAPQPDLDRPEDLIRWPELAQ